MGVLDQAVVTIPYAAKLPPATLKLFGPRSQPHEENEIAVLLVHGLGDSSIVWRELLSRLEARDLWMLAPDLPGFGKSRDAVGGRPTALRLGEQALLLLRMLHAYRVRRVLIVGHSMGGTIATIIGAALSAPESFATDPAMRRLFDGDELKSLTADIERPPALAGLINVEGNLGEEDAFFSSRTVQADRRGQFERFFRRFVQTSRHGRWARSNPAVRHYGKALTQANPEAFRTSAHDLVLWTKPGEDGSTPAQRLYASIRAPRLYVHGTGEGREQTAAWVDEQGLERIAYEGAGHWLMNEQPERFAALIEERVRQWGE